ncbi:hypothetical protein GF407_17840 [candidate division KSB1 bacterium]|nr:hypothetical protein [candidate division KSB1 bacterium]
MIRKKFMINVGFIGTGVISSLHARAYTKLDHAKLVAVCDTDVNRMRQKAAEWNVGKEYATYNDLLADKEIDAVEILTPQHLHAEMAVAAIRAGKHVSVQKPMSVTLAQGREMVEAAAKGKTLTRIYENYRFYPAIQRARELIDAGEIGEPLSIRCKLTNGYGGKGEFAHSKSEAWDRRDDIELSGGGAVTFDHGYHIYSLACYFIDTVESVFAWIGERRDADGYSWDSPAMISWKYGGKTRFGVWEQVWCEDLAILSDYYSGEDRIEISGSRGLLWITKCTSQFWQVPPLILFRDGQMTSFHHLETDWQASFDRCTRNFIDSILGKDKCEIDFPEAFEIQKMAQAVQLSAAEHRIVNLGELK